MTENFKVIIDGKEQEAAPGTRLCDLAAEFDKNHGTTSVLAVVDGRLTELHNKIKKDCEVELVTTATSIGNQTYRRSMTLLALKSFYEVVGSKNIDRVIVQYSISDGFYFEYFGEKELDEQTLLRVQERMEELVKKDIPIRKSRLRSEVAMRRFKQHRMFDKYKLFEYKLKSEISIYDIDGFEDYYYGYMAPSTGCLKHFKLYAYGRGFVVQMPTEDHPEMLAPFKPQVKVSNVLDESTRWGRMIGVGTVGDLNECIVNGRINDIILVQEALQEKKIAQIAGEIAERNGVKFIMIAGPSSSGKTTFAKRLSIELMANGMRPHAIGVDDYYRDRKDAPKDEFGNNDYESLEAVDVELLNRDMRDLLAGKEIDVPSFNFKLGKREYRGRRMSLKENDVLILEGIHCLNDALTYELPEESKFKIYISALMQLNIDEHNRISTTDLRLIRRIVRDQRTRGASAAETISMWNSVRRGEKKNIFPYQESADAIFNSASVYELAVLKQYAEPVLFSVPKNSREYLEAKKMLKFLDYFIGVSSENVPTNSLVREFIGGGCFE